MNIGDFVNEFSNHPVFFIGTGFSLRYLQNSLSWDGLLRKIAFDIKSNDEFYLDLKSQNETNGIYNYEKIASLLEIEFNNILKNERHGRYSHINDSFYENMDKGVNISRFKLYISEILSDDAKSDKFNDELPELKKARKNIASIITTNYDLLLENVFNFNPLIGNDILLSNPYGSIYKIHGCITQPSKIIITDEDYINFEKKYELIRVIRLK